MALVIPPDVVKQLKALSKADRRRLLDALETVAAEPAKRFPFVAQMAGHSGLWRLRKGHWRAVFRIRHGDVVLDRVGHRGEI